jgi:hypothetical protein
MVKTSRIPNLPLRGLYPYLVEKGVLDIRLSPYNPRGERMAAKSWNPSSFVFPFSFSIFLRILED